VIIVRVGFAVILLLVVVEWGRGVWFKWERGMLRLSAMMEDRCRLLRDKLAAVFYGDLMAYLGFAPDPIQLGYLVHYFSLV